MDVDDTQPRVDPAEAALDQTVKRSAIAVGTVVAGRYRLEAMLAAGGMGEVYRAVHVELGRPFALKLMKPALSADAGFVERFRQEAMTASKLGHPNIVDIIDSGRAESGQFYFVMEFLDGRTLTSLIEQGPVSLPLAIDLVSQVARALEVAHRAGVVHRDLKPDNVIVLERPAGLVVKIVDFGIAKVVTPSPDIKQTTHGVIMGTPQYMAPEQAAGVPLDRRADIYALGLILYELLIGTPPLTGQTAALVMSAHIAQPAPMLPAAFPQSLRALVAAMLAKRPGERPNSMTDVLAALETVSQTPTRKGLVKWFALGGVGVAIGLGALLIPARPTVPVEPTPSAASEVQPQPQPPPALQPEPPAPVIALEAPKETLDAGVKRAPGKKKTQASPSLKAFPD